MESLLATLALTIGTLQAPSAPFAQEDPAARDQAYHDDASSSLPVRPLLDVRQGRYFRYSIPDDWQARETTNGVDLIAPDGFAGASFSILIGGFGQPSARQYLEQVLRSMPELGSPRILSYRRLPSEPGVMGLEWQLGEAEIAFAYRGRTTRAHATVGVMQGAGQYSAFIRAYQSPAERWEQDRLWLPQIAETVVITNAREVAGIDRMSLPAPQAHDDIYGSYNRAWSERFAERRTSRDRQEATLGYQRMYDPQTGRYYDVPFERYDASRGGYVNPVRPTELLERPPAGE